ncbi:MAG: hypothetical protein HN790_13610 [Methylococcales bacterium]|nr:hypothetical protein [Methylococcales bacterium]
MSIYDVDTLISQARVLAANYLKMMGKPLPGMSNEIAFNDAARLLQLTLTQDQSLSYDAIGSGEGNEGKKVQIKGRMIIDDDNSNQRIGQVATEREWDSVVLLLLNAEYEPVEIFEAEREVILENTAKSSEGKKKRGAMSVARFKKIAKLVWSADTAELPSE